MKKDYSNKISNILQSFQSDSLLLQSLRSPGRRNVFIYGAGNAGTVTLKLLHDTGINIKGFFDRRGGAGVTHLGKSVFTMNDNQLAKCNQDQDIIIIAIICGGRQLKDIWRELNEMGYKNILYFHEVYSLLITNRLGSERKTSYMLTHDISANFRQIMLRIVEFASLLEDEESQSVFFNFLNSILSSNPDLFSQANKQTQYFVTDIPFSKGYSRFVDCGAFDGDTALTLHGWKGMIDAIACFEPDQENYNRLCFNLKKERVAKEQFFFPCGVWNKIEMLSFLSGKQTAGSICETGESPILCVALDNVIPDFRPTFIKMDVEGAEYEALLGAKEIISYFKPDLAISVYHRIDHMWEIPLFIKTLVPSYKFYLRCHGSHGLETILYAVAI